MSIALLELVLRVHNPLPFRVKGDQIVLQPHRKFQITNTRFSKLDRDVVHSKNSLGFRGPEPGRDFTNDLTVIAVGGSTTECFSLGDGKTWPELLQRYLGTHFRRLWTNNGGLDGHSTFGHLMLLDQHLSLIAPKVILLLVGINDVGHTSPTEYDESIEKKPLVVRADISTARSLFVRLANHSEVAAFTVNFYRYLEARERRLIRGSQVDFAALGSGTMSTDRRIDPLIEQQHQERYIPGYRDRLERLVRLSRARGIEPVLVTQPAIYGNAVDDVTGVDLGAIPVAGAPSGAAAWEMLELYNNETRTVGARFDVAVVDLARSMPKSTRYYFDFVHFTNEGSARVAELIARELCPVLARTHREYLVRPCEDAGHRGVM